MIFSVVAALLAVSQTTAKPNHASHGLDTALITRPLNRAALSTCASQQDGKLPSFVPSTFQYSGVSRKYYVKAEIEEWDFIPSGWDNHRGVPINESPNGKVYVPNPNSQIGHKYLKDVFRGYTDATLSNRTVNPEWHGIQGPLFRAEVGDMIEILLYNDLTANSTQRPVSLHGMGLTYTKGSEGSDYFYRNQNGSAATQSLGGYVQPGDCFVYKWLITNTSAPESDELEKLWSYHGDVQLDYDAQSGMAGPVLVYHPGTMASVMASHREFVIFWTLFDETMSWLYPQNIARYVPSQYVASQVKPVVGSPPNNSNITVWNPIQESAPMGLSLNTTLGGNFRSFNGRIFSNLDGVEMCQDDSVLWNIWTMGTGAGGFHVAHWHGNNIRQNNKNQATVMLTPGVMETVTMNAGSIGQWQFLCHVADHWDNGMNLIYTVYPKSSCPIPLNG